ncbi:MAG: hypothetical protein ACREPT_05860 [Rudaea sp.]
MSDELKMSAFETLPGLKLVDYRHVGLPVYHAYIDVLVEERRELHLLPEYCVRLIDAGVSKFDELTALLGLKEGVIRVALADLLRAGKIRGDESEFKLTAAGVELLSDCGDATCVEATWLVPYDGMLRCPYAWRREQLLTSRRLAEAGHRLEIGPFGERPTDSDLDVSNVSRTLSAIWPEKQLNRLISIRQVRRAPLRFVPALALGYRGDRGATQVKFLVDGRPYDQHAMAFAERGGLRRPTFKGLSTVDPDAVKLRTSTRRRLLGSTNVEPTVPKSKGDRLAMPGRDDTTKGHVYRGKIYELAKQFDDAMSSATSRLLITSRSVSSLVVNQKFTEAASHLLQRGVQMFVGIAPAMQKDEAGRPNAASTRLLQLKSSFPTFGFETLPDLKYTHLIVDGVKIIVGDYDWLSPDGAPDRIFRDRWIWQSEEEEIIEKEMQRVLRLFLETGMVKNDGAHQGNTG